MTQARTMIVGGGSLGRALAEGLLKAGTHQAQDLTVTRRRPELLADLEERGVRVSADNASGLADCRIIVLTVEPGHVAGVVRELAPGLEPERHVLVSCATGVGIDALKEAAGVDLPVVLAMPNTALAVGASMTCLASRNAAPEVVEEVAALFRSVGEAIEISEELIPAATVLGACGVAYALRFVRAASQGGIEIGFDAATARRVAAQTAFGAAKLLLDREHPSGTRDRPGHHAPRLHHRRPQRNGAPRLLVGLDQRRHHQLRQDRAHQRRDPKLITRVSLHP